MDLGGHQLSECSRLKMPSGGGEPVSSVGKDYDVSKSNECRFGAHYYPSARDNLNCSLPDKCPFPSSCPDWLQDNVNLPIRDLLSPPQDSEAAEKELSSAMENQIHQASLLGTSFNQDCHLTFPRDPSENLLDVNCKKCKTKSDKASLTWNSFEECNSRRSVFRRNSVATGSNGKPSYSICCDSKFVVSRKDGSEWLCRSWRHGADTWHSHHRHHRRRQMVQPWAQLSYHSSDVVNHYPVKNDPPPPDPYDTFSTWKKSSCRKCTTSDCTTLLSAQQLEQTRNTLPFHRSVLHSREAPPFLPPSTDQSEEFVGGSNPSLSSSYCDSSIPYMPLPLWPNTRPPKSESSWMMYQPCDIQLVETRHYANQTDLCLLKKSEDVAPYRRLVSFSNPPNPCQLEGEKNGTWCCTPMDKPVDTPITKPPLYPLMHSLSCPSPSARRQLDIRRQISAPDGSATVHTKTQLIKRYIHYSAASFFGIVRDCEESHRKRWTERRKRMSVKRFGELKDSVYVHASPSSADLQELQVPVPTIAALTSSPQTTSAHVERCLSTEAALSPVDSALQPRTRVVTSAEEPVKKRKESVFRMAWEGIAFVTLALSGQQERNKSRARVHGRSFHHSGSIDDDVFLEPLSDVCDGTQLSSLYTGQMLEDDVFFKQPEQSTKCSEHGDKELSESLLLVQKESCSRHLIDESDVLKFRRADPSVIANREYRLNRSVTVSSTSSRIYRRVVDQLGDNSNRRIYGMGVVGRAMGRRFHRQQVPTTVTAQLDDIDDHRPYFTYWVTTVQILVLFFSIVVYGFGPFGLKHTQRSGLVLVTSLSSQQVEYFEPDNFWWGPRAADLIHLGAKFAPCMRYDQNVMDAIARDRASERDTACCIRNDNSGCVQASRDECSTTISTWRKWSFDNVGPSGRISGSVCGQDPDYCSDPPSVPPYSWPDDITKWPICRRRVRSDLSRASHDHMACEVIGHPCCIGILGECHITTRDYCDFVKGYFHEEAALCSQVSCLDDICGMIPFYSPEVPDQFYRLWTSLFLHAGIGHLLLTVALQYFLMRDLEKLTGSLRIGLIYFLSGITGNLASAIFVPYRAEVGPSGAHFGLLACLIVEVLHVWPMLKSPHVALLKLLSFVIVLFIVGLVPWIDNYAHIFGFISGFLLSYAFLPFVAFGQYDRRRKITLIWLCLTLMCGLLALLFVLFYLAPIYECHVCKYFTCLPLASNFCASQDINITRKQTPV